MRHEPKLMTPGPERQIKDKTMRSLKCDECGIQGGEMTRGTFGPPTRVCCGFDDETGRPCSPLPPPVPEADTPVEIDTSAGGCSCGFRAETTEELAAHQQQHDDDDYFEAMIEGDESRRID